METGKSISKRFTLSPLPVAQAGAHTRLMRAPRTAGSGAGGGAGASSVGAEAVGHPRQRRSSSAETLRVLLKIIVIGDVGYVRWSLAVGCCLVRCAEVPRNLTTGDRRTQQCWEDLSVRTVRQQSIHVRKPRNCGVVVLTC